MARKPSLRAIYDVRAEPRYGPYIYFDELPESSQGGEGIRKKPEGIVGSSQTPSRMLDQVRAAAPADSTVLIDGKRGTGETLLVHAIDAHSVRRTRSLASPVMWKLHRFEVADGSTSSWMKLATSRSIWRRGLRRGLRRVLQEQQLEVGQHRYSRVETLRCGGNKSGPC